MGLDLVLTKLLTKQSDRSQATRSLGIRGELDPAERQLLKAALLAYCRQDTLAMVKILERLRGT
jgi:hypothetical protein